MFIAYWPVLGFVVGLVLVAVFTALLMAGRVCRARHETLPERPLSSYLPDTVSPVLKGLCLVSVRFFPVLGQIVWFACLLLSVFSLLKALMFSCRGSHQFKIFIV